MTETIKFIRKAIMDVLPFVALAFMGFVCLGLGFFLMDKNVVLCLVCLFMFLLLTSSLLLCFCRLEESNK